MQTASPTASMKSLSVLLCLAGTAFVALGQFPELTSSDLWKPDSVPFSFQYDGKQSSQILRSWQTSDEEVRAGGWQVHRYYYTDPATHLKVTAEVRLFPDFPGTVDWVLRFRNDGTTDTPISENILPLHWAIPASPGDCVIRHDKGSDANGDDFKPLEEHFGPGGKDHLEPTNGHSSDAITLPFFSLQTGDHGLIGAIGWTGNWKADFSSAQDGKSISLMAGMKATHLLLHPGEEIRTPRIVLQAWTGGSWQDSQNVWRRLILAHYTPQDDGKPMVGPVFAGSWGSEDINVKIAYIKWIHVHQIPVDLYGIDAGWYGASFGAEDDPTNPWWKNRGDWFPSPLYYPHGLKPLGDACKAAGLGFLVWIEPETAMPHMKILKEHPDWFLPCKDSVNVGVDLANSNKPGDQDLYQFWASEGNGAELANYSKHEALRGITDMVSSFITDFGMTWYRQDQNIPPEEYWAQNDKPDRVGMTEIGHIEGLYKLWDELLAKHPGLHIDNCASGGRRLDIEMMSRSFVVWRTDNGYNDLNAEQAQTTALVPWVPGTMGFETYTQSKPWTKPGPYTTPEHLYRMRLGYEAAYGVQPGEPGVDNEGWVAWIKQAIGEYREVQPYFYGDFYALLPYSRGDETWTAWQWDRPEKKDGLVIVLRRPGSPVTTKQVGLQHRDPDASYEVETRTTYDKAPLVEMKGSDLMKLQVQLPDAPSSMLVFYRQK